MFSRRVNKNEKIYTKRAHEMGKFYKENKIKLEMIFFGEGILKIVWYLLLI